MMAGNVNTESPTHEILWGNTEIRRFVMNRFYFSLYWTDCTFILHIMNGRIYAYDRFTNDHNDCLHSVNIFFGNGLSSTRGYGHTPKLLSVWRYLWTKRKLNCHALYFKDYFLASFTFIWNVIVANECK